MTTQLTLRPATADYEAEVAELWRSCNLVTSYNDPGTDFRFARAKSNSDILVGTDASGKIVGSVMVGHDGHRGWVYYVAAHPGCRKQKIGSRMIEAGEAWLRERGIPKVMLMVRDTNTQVVDFYKRIGFAIAPRTVMEKWLR